MSTALFYCCNADICGFWLLIVDLHEEFMHGLNIFLAPYLADLHICNEDVTFSSKNSFVLIRPSDLCSSS